VSVAVRVCAGAVAFIAGFLAWHVEGAALGALVAAMIVAVAVGTARALVTKPRAVLAEEPAGNLDALAGVER